MDALENDGSGNAVISDNGSNGDDATSKPTVIGGIGVVEPSSGSGGNDTTGKRGRGRPPGSGTGKRNTNSSSSRGEKASSVSIAGVEKLLHSIHMIGATFLPELALEKEESKLLAEAVTDVGAFYNQVIDPKLIAWLGLMGVCGKLYGPRIGAFAMRKQMEKDGKPATEKKKASIFSVVPKPAEKTASSGAQTMTDISASMLVSVPTTDES